MPARVASEDAMVQVEPQGQRCNNRAVEARGSKVLVVVKNDSAAYSSWGDREGSLMLMF